MKPVKTELNLLSFSHQRLAIYYKKLVSMNLLYPQKKTFATEYQ